MDIGLKMKGIQTLSPGATSETAKRLSARLSPERLMSHPASSPWPSHTSSQAGSAAAEGQSTSEPAAQDLAHQHEPLTLQLKASSVSESMHSFDVSCTLAEVVAYITNGIDAAMAPFVQSRVAQERGAKDLASTTPTGRSTRLAGTKTSPRRRHVALKGASSSHRAHVA